MDGLSGNESAGCTEANRPHRLGDILQVLLADVVERTVDLAANMPMRIVGDADTARFGNSLKARCDVDPIAEDIVVVDDDVANVNTDTKLDSEFGGHA
jgi:hypothetical protein